ncbi:flagellar hook-associated protein FlgL [Thiosulfativibrio zosterae]|uniref:Flagellar hook-filament junction protein FlgL n=1 Tax=Thiosulfativibrio zosterae TaxID=2675053 RepID=A0A6F8PLW4_9GAMM|nr:flagellar hook-associated protein FlgL [Thiosulfativibrio zosterae]BBP43075.1 flagellar hook-filament junction protein FlgL [Thiosulfativibrio zosterae]
MRVSTSQFQYQGMSAINKHQQEILNIQEKMSTGKRINKPSDDPVGMNQVHSLKTMMSKIDQFKNNGDFAKSQLSLEETQISNGVEAIQRARELSIQMANGTYNESDRKAAAAEVGQLVLELKNIMNSSNPERELLFAGNSVTADAAFVPDANNAANGTNYVAYIGSANSDISGTPIDAQANYGARFIQVSFDTDNTINPDDQGDPSRVRITDNGAQMFNIPGITTQFNGGSTGAVAFATQPDPNILNVMIEFQSYLQNGEAPPSTIAEDFDLGLRHISQNLAEIGGRQNRIESQENAGSSFKLALEERRMNIEEMDVVQGITDFTLRQNALQMAQQVFAKVQDMSLFNYIR